MNQLKQYAEQLWQARLSGKFCEPIKEVLTLEQAYAIQDACLSTAAADEQVIGYKIGATSDETLKMLGLEQPFLGPLYKSASSFNNGHNEQLQLALFTQHNSRVEAEFVVCMKNDVKRGSRDVVREDILDHIDWIAPGLEIVASRFKKPCQNLGIQAVADFGATQHMVVGEPFRQWQNLELDNHKVSLTIDEQPEIQGHSGMSIFGNPLEFVCWLLNQPQMHDKGLLAGQFISCGTCTGAPFITEGTNITADYGELGRLAAQVVGRS